MTGGWAGPIRRAQHGFNEAAAFALRMSADGPLQVASQERRFVARMSQIAFFTRDGDMRDPLRMLCKRADCSQRRQRFNDAAASALRLIADGQLEAAS